MPAHYDDPKFFYQNYWSGRDYEHECEVLAITKLIGSFRYDSSADIGGGYGRLTSLISRFSKKTYLVEPSNKQRQLAKKTLDHLKNTSIISGTAQQTHLTDSSLDLVLMVRVMHHLPQPEKSVQELFRILKPGGTLILEFANSIHFKARLHSLITGIPIPTAPIEKRSNTNIRKKTIPFVNHHPESIIKLLTKTGFILEKTLSVSNFRSGFIKQILPLKLLLILESRIQDLASKFNFGPSIFIMAHKPSSLNIDK